MLENLNKIIWISEPDDDFTSFALFDNQDRFHYGRTEGNDKPSTLQVGEALQSIDDSVVFPPSSECATLPLNTSLDLAHVHTKRPPIMFYDIFHLHKQLHLIPEMFIHEVRIMEFLAKHPHPGIIRYHGCRIRRGHITGIVLDKLPQDLEAYSKTADFDRAALIADLRDAVRHLHSLELAHNDLNPGNVMINEGKPVIIDFGSCHKIGEKLGVSRGTFGWIECDMSEYHTSAVSHDEYALNKIEEWLTSAPTA